MSVNFKAPKMLKLQGGEDYLAWAHEAEAHIRTNYVWKYIDPTKPLSLGPDNEAGRETWNANARKLLWELTLMIDRPLQHLIEKCSTAGAGAAWIILSDKFSTQGPMFQIILMKKALAARFSPGTTIDQTILELDHTLDTMFDVGEIKEETWKPRYSSTLYYAPILDGLEDLLMVTETGVDFDGFVSSLRHRLRSQAETTVTEEAHAASLSIEQTQLESYIANCNKPGHSQEKCRALEGCDEGGGDRMRATQARKETSTIGTQPMQTSW